GLDALPDGGRTEEHRERRIVVEHDLGGLLRAGGAALNEATERDAVIAAVDQLTLQLLLLVPADLGEAAIERRLIVAAVELVLALERRDGRKPVRHLAIDDEITAAELDAIEPQVLRDHVEQPLAEKVRLEPTGAPIGADRRLVGHEQRHVDVDVLDAVRT